MSRMKGGGCRVPHAVHIGKGTSVEPRAKLSMLPFCALIDLFIFVSLKRQHVVGTKHTNLTVLHLSLPPPPSPELLHWGELCVGPLIIKGPLSPVFLMRASSSGTHRGKECFADHSSGTSKSYRKIIPNALTTFCAVFQFNFFIFCFHS